MEREKKECILTAAARAFSRFGFKKASVDEIARDAGVAKGTVYLACDSKEDLFYQVVHRELRNWSAEIAKMIDPRVPAEQLLLEAAVFGVGYLDQRPLVRDLLSGTYQGLLPHWAERFDELRALGRGHVMEILRLGIRQGRFRADLDVEMVATILLDIHAATYLFHNREAPDRLERLERRLRAGMDLVINGIKAAGALAAADRGAAAARVTLSDAGGGRRGAGKEAV